MLIAIKDGQRIRPSLQIRRAICTCCNDEVVARTGEYKSWHWAHKSNSNCYMSKGKGEWHYRIQSFFDNNEVEVRDPMWPNNIADICIRDERLRDGYLVIELQESSISGETIRSRNEAYKNIFWIYHDKKQTERYPKSIFYSVDKNERGKSYKNNNDILVDINVFDQQFKIKVDEHFRETMILIRLYIEKTREGMYPINMILRKDEWLLLDVPIHEKEEVKSLNGRWCPELKMWYVEKYRKPGTKLPNLMPLRKYEKWRTKKSGIIKRPYTIIAE